tara:strand:+ start:200 stop:688 length:489 start_codon:yes stop_codon:yes gene_type:complete
MHDEDILLRSNRGFAYLCVAPCILFSAAVWFTPNSAGIVIAHAFQIYFSILLFYLSISVWSTKANFDESYISELKTIAIVPVLLAMLGAFLTLYANPAWGIGFLTVGFYLFRFVRFSFLIFQDISIPYLDLFNRISIILCICLVLIFTYWLNPYSNPIEIYI